MKKITLYNFRCFENFEWDFTPGINLIVGDNSSGKTSLLRACRLVAGSFFAGFSDENTVCPGPEAADFRDVIVDGVKLPVKAIEIQFLLDAEMYPDIDMAFKRGDDEIAFNPSMANPYFLRKNSPKNTKQLTSGISAYKAYCKALQENENQNLPLPLFAFFSTEDIHASRKIDAGKFKEEYLKRSFGYYFCLDSNGLLPYWEKRLLVMKELQQDCVEVKVVTDALLNALGESGCGILRDVSVRPMRGKVYYTLADGRVVDSAILSDGYKRLVNIVMDLAFRSYILNRPTFGADACKYSRGTVLVDEVDLHLHPSLQVRALPSIAATFPGIQFIATTHAPLVMSSVGNNERDTVSKIEFDGRDSYSRVAIDAFGFDASSIMTSILGVYDRDINVQHDLDSLFGLIDDERIEEARAMFDAMKEKYGNLPDLARAGVTIDFFSPEL
ncbi:hypothetical protein EEL33_06340 [Muribaculaceae bacterium Isolate-037 (Harlan)]|jgi:predicted ATP-binding protein involved in virulence|nr:hypothetical protein EEL33_06340 [Muribaculaceae bacterium Isolate-037 (Harlan)]